MDDDERDLDDSDSAAQPVFAAGLARGARPVFIPDWPDAPAVLRHLDRVLGAADIDELWHLHTSVMRDYGFDRLLYGVTRYLDEAEFINLDDTFILSNLPKRYLDIFFRQNLYRNAPMLLWALNNSGCRSWRHVQEQYRNGEMPPAQMRVVDINRSFGITAGYTISFNDMALRTKGAIGLCAQRDLTQDDVDRVWRLHGRDILVINTLTHLRITSMPQCRSSRALTARQREVLEWVGHGKTIQDIATIMGLTPGTIEKHLRLARRTLNVDSTPQALLKASLQNQIYTAPRQP